MGGLVEKGIPCGSELEQLHVPARPKPRPEELQGARPLNHLHDAQEEAASSAHTAVARPSEQSRLQAGDTCAPVSRSAELAKFLTAHQALGDRCSSHNQEICFQSCPSLQARESQRGIYCSILQ